MDAMLVQYRYDECRAARQLWMDADCLLDLRDRGHVIGLHSHTHPTQMAKLSPADQEKEYAANFSILEKVLGKRPSTMSHPCNSYDKETLAILKKMGIQLGFRAEPVGSPTYGLLEWPREDHINLVKEFGL
jgi:peptidoglycan/xylan/chitin deacetylase (PgdA/CDA1 family)